MEPNPVIDTLNALRRVEATSLLPRLAECIVFVAPGSAAGHADLQRMIDEENEHLRRLDETILDLGGNLVPYVRDIRSADLHYVAWSALLPRLGEDQRRLAGAFEAAGPQVAEVSQAAAVVSGIAASHHDHARQLDRVLEQTRHDSAP